MWYWHSIYIYICLSVYIHIYLLIHTYTYWHMCVCIPISFSLPIGGTFSTFSCLWWTCRLLKALLLLWTGEIGPVFRCVHLLSFLSSASVCRKLQISSRSPTEDDCFSGVVLAANDGAEGHLYRALCRRKKRDASPTWQPF